MEAKVIDLYEHRFLAAAKEFGDLDVSLKKMRGFVIDWLKEYVDEAKTIPQIYIIGGKPWAIPDSFMAELTTYLESNRTLEERVVRVNKKDSKNGKRLRPVEEKN